MRCSFACEQDQVFSTSKQTKEQEAFSVETQLDNAYVWDLCTEMLLLLSFTKTEQ